MSADVIEFTRERAPHPAKQTQKPEVLQDLAEQFDREEQRLLEKRFRHIHDVEFAIDDHYPFLKLYCQEAGKSTDAKPQALITALLPALASNVGNKVFIQCGSRRHFCNIWSIIIAPSSIGRKTTSLNLAANVLRAINTALREQYDAEQEQFNALFDDEKDDAKQPIRRYAVYPSAPAEQFLAILQNNPNGLLYYSEIADFLTKMGKSYNADLKAMLTAMFDGIGGERSTRSHGDEYVENPAFSIATATTKEWLLREMDRENDVNSGFLQRFLVCNSNDIDFDALNFTFRDGKKSTEHLYNMLSQVYGAFREIGSIDNPVEITLSEEAKALYEREHRASLKAYFEDNESRMYSYATRLFNDYFFRFCILFELLTWYFKKDPGDVNALVVSATTAHYAHRLCYYYLHNIAGFLETELNDNRDDRNEKAIVKAFQGWKTRHDTDVIKHSVLLKLSHLSRKEFFEAIEGLEEQEVILSIQKKAANNKVTTYYRLLLKKDMSTTTREKNENP